MTHPLPLAVLSRCRLHQLVLLATEGSTDTDTPASSPQVTSRTVSVAWDVQVASNSMRCVSLLPASVVSTATTTLGYARCDIHDNS
jgi:hypothetical protein